ncbi:MULTISPECIES: hypothetical protein [unclassified Tolypothrix]|uniref:hypothetical protein n=1 Tax=unclassified Tolypothrix TaxID=2649714 RepID=UPI0005EAA6B4|nr:MULTISPECIES: hypothetical protein [unclassified Tolypothrix]BAY93718.1 hypothetical protein NIES3275_57600 [Microchaete diplosiphon NIES-3275]EKF03280.1 hypothetical protein FDUTEX481_02739 [Tolypothrix sp. PCC 7601]MBE9082550.1 hypothetical protein [Tolypothrix sp. LEGE 11397]UYD27528.1 hypothetical protein HGR01_05450 [Tolypothrix sp. PCC 7712]UYD36610.1 hypothetical protein HG267_13260 [Tolypothrix sp. PCC 7601]
MRPSNCVWQGNFGYWQNSFIHNNILVIGYTAWKGFQSFGRGVVLCDVDIQVTHPTITSLDTVKFTLQFLPLNLIGFYLQTFQDSGLISQSICSSMISSISPTVATYNPYQDILLVLKAEHQIEVNFLHKLKITPPDCYEQVCTRWSEFKPSLIP